ncbi:MAG TPA: ATP-grasp domain-containing protein [Pyrinomonadaceae bacterium]
MKILVVEPGSQYFKERFIREFTNCPFELFLLVNSSPRIPHSHWYHRYIPQTRVFSADFRNTREAAKSVREQLTAQGIRLSGVTTYYEDAVLVAQAIAEELSLPPITTGDPLALRNKNLMRLRFAEAGLPQPRSILCRTMTEAEGAIRQIGFPCVVKPSQLSASIGVRKISSGGTEIDHALRAAFTDDIREEDTRHAYDIPAEIVVEEYIPTYQEVSCEGLVHAGEVQLLAVTRKYLSPEPLFDEIGHATPYQVADEVRATLAEQLSRAADSLKLYNTAFHAEFRLRDGAPPVIVELGARLPGGFIPQLVRLSRGVDMLEASLRLAVGLECNVVPQNIAVAAIRFMQDDATARRFALAADQIRALTFVDEIAIYDGVGLGRRGHVIWTARNFSDMEDGWEKIITRAL